MWPRVVTVAPYTMKPDVEHVCCLRQKHVISRVLEWHKRLREGHVSLQNDAQYLPYRSYDFHIFGELKKHIRGHRFASDKMFSKQIPYLFQFLMRKILLRNWKLNFNNGLPKYMEDVNLCVKNIQLNDRENPFNNNIPGIGWYRAILRRHP